MSIRLCCLGWGVGRRRVGRTSFNTGVLRARIGASVALQRNRNMGRFNSFGRHVQVGLSFQERRRPVSFESTASRSRDLICTCKVSQRNYGKFAIKTATKTAWPFFVLGPPLIHSVSKM